ncbi:MAG: aldehyde dehydrogenase EutE [Deltaproteobacteria bacterium]|nr:aldehyde dehydrogenase EutE [Deltaproteobacteria bacterium]
MAGIIHDVLAELQQGARKRQDPNAKQHGVFRTVDDAVSAAQIAHQTLVAIPLEKRKEIIANIRKRAAEDVHTLAEMAHEETGLGRVEDKIKKNLLVIHKTPGPEILQPIAYTGDDGLALIERAPFGVVASITPCTNPTETILNNGIGMVSGGNAVTFNTHPAAKGVSAYCVDLINRASMEVGGPSNIMTCIHTPTIDSAGALMHHKGTPLVVVTGGGGVVKAAMQSGKKCVAAGPGNPPVVVDETADLDRAARGIYNGASFDNNIICTDEKEVMAVEKIFDPLLERIESLGAVRLRNHQIRRLESLILTPDRMHTNRDWIGKCPSEMLKAIDVPFRGDPRLIVCDVPFEHPFVQLELLMPVIGFVRCADVHQAIDKAVEAEHGYRHTASMYSRNIESLHRMARAVNCSIFIKNASNYAGLGFGGEGYTSFTIASPTGDGLTTARTFTRERRCTLSGYFRIV